MLATRNHISILETSKISSMIILKFFIKMLVIYCSTQSKQEKSFISNLSGNNIDVGRLSYISSMWRMNRKHNQLNYVILLEKYHVLYL
jgi:hypothetical protein